MTDGHPEATILTYVGRLGAGEFATLKAALLSNLSFFLYGAETQPKSASLQHTMHSSSLYAHNPAHNVAVVR